MTTVERRMCSLAPTPLPTQTSSPGHKLSWPAIASGKPVLSQSPPESSWLSQHMSIVTLVTPDCSHRFMCVASPFTLSSLRTRLWAKPSASTMAAGPDEYLERGREGGRKWFPNTHTAALLVTQQSVGLETQSHLVTLGELNLPPLTLTYRQFPAGCNEKHQSSSVLPSKT